MKHNSHIEGFKPNQMTETFSGRLGRVRTDETVTIETDNEAHRADAASPYNISFQGQGVFAQRDIERKQQS